MSQTHNPVYTHFKGKDVTRYELIERIVVETILKSKLPNKDRSWSKTFELKHSSSVIQIGRMLAQKRHLDAGLAAVICALHDIYVFTTGRAADHAHQGAPITKKILKKTKKFSAKEITLIANAVYDHSDKLLVSKDPYTELVKDADVLDCGLLDGAHDAYVYEKSKENCRSYFNRMKAVRKELGLPKDPQWDSLNYIERGKKFYAKHKA